MLVSPLQAHELTIEELSGRKPSRGQIMYYHQRRNDPDWNNDSYGTVVRKMYGTYDSHRPVVHYPESVSSETSLVPFAEESSSKVGLLPHYIETFEVVSKPNWRSPWDEALETGHIVSKRQPPPPDKPEVVHKLGVYTKFLPRSDQGNVISAPMRSRELLTDFRRGRGAQMFTRMKRRCDEFTVDEGNVARSVMVPGHALKPVSLPETRHVTRTPWQVAEGDPVGSVSSAFEEGQSHSFYAPSYRPYQQPQHHLTITEMDAGASTTTSNRKHTARANVVSQPIKPTYIGIGPRTASASTTIEKETTLKQPNFNATKIAAPTEKFSPGQRKYGDSSFNSVPRGWSPSAHNVDVSFAPAFRMEEKPAIEELRKSVYSSEATSQVSEPMKPLSSRSPTKKQIVKPVFSPAKAW